MPVITLRASHEHWVNQKDPKIYQIICFLDQFETWTHDGDDGVEESLQLLGEAMENIEHIDLKERDDFLTLFAHIKTSRALYILALFDNAYPGFTERLMRYADTVKHSNEYAKLFSERITLFERMRALCSIFHESRGEVIQMALEGENHAS